MRIYHENPRETGALHDFFYSQSGSLGVAKLVRIISPKNHRHSASEPVLCASWPFADILSSSCLSMPRFLSCLPSFSRATIYPFVSSELKRDVEAGCPFCNVTVENGFRVVYEVLSIFLLTRIVLTMICRMKRSSLSRIGTCCTRHG